MIYSQSLVAKQYAKAYLLEFENLLTLADIENMKSAVRFFRRHHNFMSLVSLMTKIHERKHVMIDEIFSHFSLHSSLKKLVTILLRHKRLLYFAQVLQDICSLFEMRSGVLHVTIQTATPLTESEIAKFESFFAKLSGKRIISQVHIDPSLIAGVRMQSDIYLWEYSIAARLRHLRHKMLIEG
ncbi:MAG TPA: F0F1 ATP synthase subunit delta [Candidatus Saccharimonadales bacterium]|nr:F0F1 ATP synthase subunit delta [Candidatus Saccharimonadales bacterium]